MQRKRNLIMRCIMVVLAIVALVIMFFGNIPGKVESINAADNPYLTFTGDTQFKLSVRSGNKIWDGTMEYSTDASNWTEWDGTEISSAAKDNQFVLYLRGKGNTRVSDENAMNKIYPDSLSLSAYASCSGNIMTLLDYENPGDIVGEKAFAGLFCKCIYLTSAPKLPAKTLSYYSYYSMFAGCTDLTSAPELPAEILATSCYSSMFEGCTGLTSAPKLPAKTLANDCYCYMFEGCTGLTSAPKLSAKTLTYRCYGSMFEGCTKLISAPELPAENLAGFCYFSMFEGCTSLTSAPKLEAEALANSCYYNMFSGCTDLTSAPELPATTLAEGCYDSMFFGCTGLTSVPELPATSLADYCYNRMFEGCTNIYISDKKEPYNGITYKDEIRIPKEGDGTAGTDSTNNMFKDTGGVFTGTPDINKTYYLGKKSFVFEVLDNNVTYDGKPHGITISVTDPANGAIVKYGLTENNCDLDKSPAITNVSEGPIKIYYTISADNRYDYVGDATLTINAADSNVETPTGLTATYGQTLADVKLPDDWSWSDNTLSVGNAGTNSFKANYSSTDTNYKSKSDVDICLAVGKVTNLVTKAPTGKTLKYNGEKLELVEAGKVSAVNMMYAVGENATTAPTSGWSSSIPTEEKAGTYYIWYKAGEDNNHYESKTECVTSKILAPISSKVVFNVSDGAWNDDTTEDKIVTLTGYEGDILTLSEDQIPSAGDKPDDGYKAGSWDIEPITDKAITQDTTYTYSYIEKDKISAKVTFKVSDGSWNDGTTEDKIVTLTGYEGDALKFTADQIPEAGEKPKESFKEGSWDVIPSADKVITADTTYTYSYKEKEKEKEPEEKDPEEEEAVEPEQTPEPPSYSEEWVDGIWYNADGSQTYPHKGGWKKDDIGWWYQDESGWYPTEKWEKIDHKWYYFDATGYMLTNQYAGKWDPYSEGNWWVGADGAWDGSEPGVWRLKDDKWYFSDSTGWIAKNGWYRICGKWYKFDSEGWIIEEQ